MKNAVLKIWYTKDGKSYLYNQGKIYQSESKWIYLADMTPNTIWKNFNGYSIAEQILTAFSKAKIRPRIIYREKHKGQLLFTTPSKFKKKGIKVAYGGHTQYILCLPYWEIKQGDLGGEPFNLPIMECNSWLKPEIKFIGGGFAFV